VTTPLPRRVTPPPSQPARKAPVEVQQKMPATSAAASPGRAGKGLIWAAVAILLCLAGGGGWYFLRANSTAVDTGANAPSTNPSPGPATPEVKKDTEPSAQSGPAPPATAQETAASPSPAADKPAQPAVKKEVSAARAAEIAEKRRKEELKQRVGEFTSRGLEAYKAGNYDSAINSFQAALQLDPDNQEAKSGLNKVKEAQAEEEKLLKGRRP